MWEVFLNKTNYVIKQHVGKMEIDINIQMNDKTGKMCKEIQVANVGKVHRIWNIYYF